MRPVCRADSVCARSRRHRRKPRPAAGPVSRATRDRSTGTIGCPGIRRPRKRATATSSRHPSRPARTVGKHCHLSSTRAIRTRRPCSRKPWRSRAAAGSPRATVQRPAAAFRMKPAPPEPALESTTPRAAARRVQPAPKPSGPRVAIPTGGAGGTEQRNRGTLHEQVDGASRFACAITPDRGSVLIFRQSTRLVRNKHQNGHQSRHPWQRARWPGFPRKPALLAVLVA